MAQFKYVTLAADTRSEGETEIFFYEKYQQKHYYPTKVITVPEWARDYTDTIVNPFHESIAYDMWIDHEMGQFAAELELDSWDQYDWASEDKLSNYRRY